MNAEDPTNDEPFDAHEGEEPSGGTLATSKELEQALREAAEAVDHRGKKKPASSGGGPVIAVTREEHDGVLAKLEAAQAELEELKDGHLRLQADFENLRKRTMKERQDAHQFGHEGLVRDLLGTVDNLDRALEHARSKDGGDLKGLIEGVELVQRELLGALSAHAVTKVEAEGKIFDPNVHEAMAQAESDEVPVGTVLQVFQEGYQLRDRLLRPSRVLVSRKPEAGSAEESPHDESTGEADES